MESLNEAALLDILIGLAEHVERCVRDIERLRGVIYEDDRLRERYLAGVERTEAEVYEESIRLLLLRLQTLRHG